MSDKPLSSLKKREKQIAARTFWSRVWQGDDHALQVLSLILFIGVFIYFIFPYLYEHLLGRIVEDVIQRLPGAASIRG